MPASTLDVDESTPPVTHNGHGTDALGPSDSSDSGSDLQGPGVYESEADVIGLDRGTNEDMEHAGGAGSDLGDTNLDSDTDSGGTGERASAGRDTDNEAGSDIAPDRLIGSNAPIPADVLDRIAVDEDDDSGDDGEGQERDRRFSSGH